MDKQWKAGLYEWSLLGFCLALPLVGALVEFLAGAELVLAAFKWLVFSGVGLRLFAAGARQVFAPERAAADRGEAGDALIVRELGFASLSFGVLGLVSLFAERFRLPAAVAGGLFFGLAGMGHLARRGKGPREWFATVSDLVLYAALLLLALAQAAV